MCKYDMDPASIVEDTERTRFCPQTDGQTDRWTDRRTYDVKPVYFVEAGGILTIDHIKMHVHAKIFEGVLFI